MRQNEELQKNSLKAQFLVLVLEIAKQRSLLIYVKKRILRMHGVLSHL